MKQLFETGTGAKTGARIVLFDFIYDRPAALFGQFAAVFTLPLNAETVA
jgi:hypothetical protein